MIIVLCAVKKILGSVFKKQKYPSKNDTKILISFLSDIFDDPPILGLLHYFSSHQTGYYFMDDGGVGRLLPFSIMNRCWLLEFYFYLIITKTIQALDVQQNRSSIQVCHIDGDLFQL